MMGRQATAGVDESVAEGAASVALALSLVVTLRVAFVPGNPGFDPSCFNDTGAWYVGRSKISRARIANPSNEEDDQEQHGWIERLHGRI